MNKKNIGKNIQTLRKICGMTQAELADRVGVSTDHISHIEIGSGSISLPLLLEICTLLNTTPNDILFGEFSAAPSEEHSDVSREEPFDSINPNDDMNADEAQLLNYMYHFITRQKQDIHQYSRDSV